MSDNELEKLLKDLISRPTETEWIEFKENNKDPHRLGLLISALSNSANIHNEPFGYIIFGVHDETHEVVGTSFDVTKEKVENEDLEHWLINNLNPKVAVHFYSFQYNLKRVVIVEVPATIDRPISFKEHGYIRVGSVTRKLKEFPDLEKKIWNNSSYKNFEKNAAKGAILDAKTVLTLLSYPTYFKLLRLNTPSDQKTIIDKLIQDNVIEYKRGVYSITNLGAVLIGENLEAFSSLKRKIVRVITYEGDNKIRALKEKKFTRGYAIDFPLIIEYLDDQLPSNEEIRKATRMKHTMYPIEALRELVANALIHQDFNEKGTSIAIEIYKGRIEISNPGKPLINVERFMDNPPKSRNEDLAALMRRMKFCEERGTGIDRVVNLCEVFQLPAPKFEETSSSLKVTLYAYKPLNKMLKEDKIRACYQHCTLKYLTNDPMNNASLRNRFKINEKNYSIASRIISDTMSAKLIKPLDGSLKAKRYIKYMPFWA